MRDEFARSMIALFQRRSDLVFLTGDVGYLAVEEIAVTYGERFINAGIAEQNMVSLAAGLAHEGHLPWVYSIAPFVAFRPYEQIRTDVCLHKLPVKLVGGHPPRPRGCRRHAGPAQHAALHSTDGGRRRAGRRADGGRSPSELPATQ
jgi:transketolase C-terminal domain/subunit